MTAYEKTAPEVAASETAKELGMGSDSRLYLSRYGQSTRTTLGTWSGQDLPIEDYALVVVSRDLLADLAIDGEQTVTLNPACLAAHDEAARRTREKKAEEARQAKLDKLRRRIIEEEFEDELAAADHVASEIWGRIDARMNEILEAAK
ncbi:hypothetical protein [Corynebacterium pacaense]|uniref:hypothetical protein n=1 Tax=Corynebacterium pacaense TaxID=1816684 RepID=UPI0009BABE3B|nr:hypothetical protein [Corynebacterium pacaense]